MFELKLDNKVTEEKNWFEINGKVITFVIANGKKVELLSCTEHVQGNMFKDTSEIDVYKHNFKDVPTVGEIVELVKTRAAVFSV